MPVNPALSDSRPIRAIRRRLSTFVGLALVLALLPVMGASDAHADPLYGHDISWPQCPSTVGGYGLPMPPSSTSFVIVGLTKGLAFTENPCLVSQVSWFRSTGTPAQAYTMATFPTTEQLTAYGSAGPWGSATRADRLRNVGFAEAQFALASLARVGWSPPVVWIDVEPRSAQPWPSSTPEERTENRFILTGMMRALREAGVGSGFYSYASGWQAITGSWQLPGVPVWATAGRLDYPTEALDRCTQTSFSGGPVYLSQWYDSTRDYDLSCGDYRFTQFALGPFVDVAPGALFAEDIAWLWSAGISHGWLTPEGTSEFRPATDLSRSAMAAFLYRAGGSPPFAPPATSPFVDVTPSHPFYREIAWLAARGISRGWPVGDGTFRFEPDSTTSREATAAFLYRMQGAPAVTAPASSPFSDVPTTHPFYPEIAWLAMSGISRGWATADGNVEFRPAAAVSREAMAAFLRRADAIA